MEISVVIPTFNRRHVIADAIDSVLSQRGLPADVRLGVIVVDDRSQDDTVAWLNRAYEGRPVKVLQNQGAKGPAGGRNTGMALAAGKHVAFLDSDDRFLPYHLAEAVDVMREHPGVDVVFGRARYLRAGQVVDYMGPNFVLKLGLAAATHETESLAVFDHRFFAHLLEQGCWFNLSTVVLSPAAAAQRMREDLRVAEDYEFWVRLARSHRFACLKNEQIEYVLGDDNISFEASAQVEGHTPQMLRAYAHMRAYDGLSRSQLRLIDGRIAGELFDWGWRARQAGMRWTAFGLHARSFRYGRRPSNVAAALKSLFMGRASED